MSWAAVIVGGVSLAAGAISSSQAKKQMDNAEAMSLANPGYQGNPALEANAQMLQNRFTNYTLPNYTSAVESIDRQAEMGFRAATQGALSSSDILDAATRIAYGSQLANNQLNVAQAQGEDAAMMDYLTANQMAGQNIAEQNEWERMENARRRQERAQLYNAGMINQNNAIQGAVSTVGQFAGYTLQNGGFGSGGNNNNAGGNNFVLMPGAQTGYNPNVLNTTNLNRGVNFNNNPYLPKTLS